MSGGVGVRLSLDPVLLLLWYRPAAVASILSLAWERPYAVSAASKSKKKKKYNVKCLFFSYVVKYAVVGRKELFAGKRSLQEALSVLSLTLQQAPPCSTPLQAQAHLSDL